MTTTDIPVPPTHTFEDIITKAVAKEDFKLAALSYLAKAETEKLNPATATAYATMAQAFATLELAAATYEGN